MNTLELTLQRKTDSGYPVAASLTRPGGFLPLRREGLLNLNPAELSRGDPADLDELQYDPLDYGTALGKALFADEIRDTFCEGLSGGEPLRVLLSVEAPDLRALDWHRLAAPFDGRWRCLASQQNTPFSLSIPSPASAHFPAIGRRDLRALVLVAGPESLSGDYKLAAFDVPATLAGIQESLGDIPCDVLQNPSLDALCAALTQTPYAILHIVCHGAVKENGETILFFPKDSKGGPTPASELLNRLSSLARLPHFAFVAACESALPQNGLGPLAGRLVRELGLPAVLAMTDRVSIATANAITAPFYTHLYQHGQPDLALAQSLAGQQGAHDLTVPAIFSRLGDRPLFDDNAERALTDKELEFGLAKLAELLPERAPVLTIHLDTLTRRLRSTLGADFKSLSDSSRTERTETLSALNSLSLEALDLSFNALCLGQTPPAYDSRSPFRGLESFRPEDKDYFFGRETLTRKLVQKLNEHNFLAVLGASGSGKSSLVMAGLIPALNVPYAIFRPGAEPNSELDKALQANPQLLVVDQFEELFTLSPREQRPEFISRLLEQVQRLRVVITLRADFLGEVAPFKSLKDEVQSHQEIIPPMDEAELRRSMEAQAACAGLRFESDLSQQMLDDVSGEPGAMPLLQHALWTLWTRRHGRWLRAEEYRAFGGVRQAIASTAEAVFARCTDFERERLRDIFLRLTRLDESADGRDTRRRVLLRDLIPADSDPAATTLLIKQLADARLVVVTGDEVEVAHEALIRYWERLRTWLKDDRDNLRLREGVSDDARQWENAQRDESLLNHRGPRLELALSMSKNPHYRLNPVEQAYLAGCVGLREREKVATIRRRRYILAGVSAALLVIMAILTGWGVTSNKSANEKATQVALAQTSQANAEEQTEKAQQQSRFAFARVLANQAASFHTVDYQLALLLATEAVKTTYTLDGVATLEAMTVLRGLLSESYRPIILGTEDESFTQVIFSPNEKYLAAVSDVGTVHVWNTTTGEQELELRNLEGVITTILFSTDSNKLIYASTLGKIVVQNIEQTAEFFAIENGSIPKLVANRPQTTQIAVSGDDGVIRIWDWQEEILVTALDINTTAISLDFRSDGTEALIFALDGSVQIWQPNQNPSLLALEPPGSSVTSVVIDPVWRWVTIAKADGALVEWDILNRQIRRAIPETNIVRAFYAPSGLRIITSQSNGMTTLWDTDTHKRMATLTERELLGMQPYLVKTNETGKILLIARELGQASVWEAENGGQIYTLADFDGKILMTDISQSGRFIVTVHEDQKIRLWNAVSEPDRLTLQGLSKGAWRVVFDQSGKYLAAAGQDGIAIVWETTSGAITVQMVGHQVGDAGAAGINNLAFNPAGDKLATAGWDKTARIWDTTKGTSLLVLPHQEIVTDVSFNPTGEYLASSDLTGVYLWDTTNGKLVIKWATEAEVNRLAFDKTGTFLAAAGATNSSWVWNISTKEKAADLQTESSMTYLQFSPTGDQLAAVGFDGKAYIWDTATWKVLAALPGMDDSMWSFAYSLDGSKLVTGGDKGKVRIWNSKTGELLLAFQGHSSRIWSISYSTQGTIFATGGEDGTVRLWDSNSGAALAILPDIVGAKSLFNFNIGESNLNQTLNLESGVIALSSNESGVTVISSDKPPEIPWVMAINFDPKGEQIASANLDGTVDLYVANVEFLLELARARIDRELTCQERVQFLYENIDCEPLTIPTP